MMTLRSCVLLGSFLMLAAASAEEKYAEPEYPKPPEAEAAPGIPQGSIQRFTYPKRENGHEDSASFG